MGVSGSGNQLFLVITPTVRTQADNGLHCAYSVTNLVNEPIHARPTAPTPGYLPAAEPVHHGSDVRRFLRDHLQHRRPLHRGGGGGVPGGDTGWHGWSRSAHDRHADRVWRAVRLAFGSGQFRPRPRAGDVYVVAVDLARHRAAVGQAGLGLRLHLRGLRRAAAGALQYPGGGGRQALFPGLGQSRGGGGEHVVRVDDGEGGLVGQRTVFRQRRDRSGHRPADGQPLPLFQLQVAADGRTRQRAVCLDGSGGVVAGLAVPGAGPRIAGGFLRVSAVRAGVDDRGADRASTPCAATDDMNVPMNPAVTAAHRTRVLHALGLAPWVRRAATGEPAGVVPAVAEPLPDGTGVACVVILPERCSARELDLLGRALQAGGAILARAARIPVRDGQLAADVPTARAYLVFGDAQAH